MATNLEIVRLAVDNYHGKVEKYSADETNEVLRQALIAANGGKTEINLKSWIHGESNGLFALIEEILARVIPDGLQGDEYFNQFVDFRNVAAGDQNLFVVEDSDLFVVAEAANGTQGIRRQRLGGATTTSIPTTLKVVKIYEELNRVLSGQIDLNKMIDKVAKSVRARLLDDVYSLWTTASNSALGGSPYGVTSAVAGTYDEDELMNVIAHVEAAAGGKNATVIGTKKALRNLAPSIQGAESKSDLYNMGYYGKFYGSDVFCTPQRHKVGTSTFTLADNIITVVAGDDKPLKVVYEGQSLILNRSYENQSDLTINYMYGDMYGMGIILAGGNAGIGRYTIA